MIEAACVNCTTDSLVQVNENGQKAIFHNQSNEMFECISSDKCVMRQMTSADYVISKYRSGDVIVELKGKNVERGVQQVLATAKHWHDNGYRAGKIAGLIICKQYPSGSTSVQKAKDQFRKLYNAPLHIVTKNMPLHLDCLFSFRGPYKT